MKVLDDAMRTISNRPDAVSGDGPAPATPGSADAGSGGGGSSDAGGERSAEGGGAPKKRTRKRKRKPAGAGTVGPNPGGGPGGPGGASGRNRKKKGSGSPTGHANDAIRSLSAMLKSVFDSQKVHFLSRPRYTEVNLRVPLDPNIDGPRAASKLVDAVLKLVREVRDNDNALAPGSVYCYFNESAEAEGCRPTEPREVFDGYSSTGRPQFTDFVTMAIERKAEGIDGLLAGEDVTLTHVSQGRVLRTAQLQEFGKASPVFRIVGQVDAGLFGVRGQEAKAAFSFQVLLGKDLQGQHVLRVHPVGRADVLNLVDHSVAQILQRFQGDLDELSLRMRGLEANGETVDPEEIVLPLLQDLAKRLQDRSRHRSRRTEHAEQRAVKSTRPTTKAYDEAAQVTDDNLLFDDQESTVVVVGGNGRVHVFTPEGKHVTSINMNRATVQQRLKTHRWRNTEPGERGSFRMQIRSLMKSRRDAEGEPRGRAKKRERRNESDDLQSKIAGMMAGLGAAAVVPADPEADAVSPTTGDAEATAGTAAETAAETTAEAPAATPAETPAEAPADPGADAGADQPGSAEAAGGAPTSADAAPESAPKPTDDA